MELQQMTEKDLERGGIEQFLSNEIFEKYAFSDNLLSDFDIKNYFQLDEMKKALIVEDDFSQMNILEDLILEINPEVRIDWEFDINRAIDKLGEESRKGRSYDLVICDIELGTGLSGIDLFQYCADFEPSVSPILISAHSRRKLHTKYTDIDGPLDYLMKPINFEVFYQRVAPILNSDSI